MGHIMNKERAYKACEGIVIFTLCVVITYLGNPELQQYCDAAGYWEIYGKGFFNDNVELFRGVYFPVMLGACSSLGKYGMKIWYAMSFAVISYCFVLYFSNKKASYLNNAMRVLFAFLIFALFYWGLFAYVLSDIWALFFGLGSLVFLEKTTDNINPLLHAFGAGFLAYISYNIRTIYFSLILGVFIILIVGIIRCSDKIMWTIRSGLFVLGGGVASIPQVFYNFRETGLISPKVPTNSLYMDQLVWGLMYQRYDTYVGTEVDSPQVIFKDIVGQAIIEYEGVPSSFVEYLGIIIKHPIEMLGVYFRHLFNMLFPVYPEIYIFDFNHIKFPMYLGAFFVIYIILLVFIYDCISDKKTLIFMAPILLPVIFIIPGSVEARFGMPLMVYFLIILFVCSDINKLYHIVKLHWFKTVVLGALLFGLILSIWTNTLMSYNGSYTIWIK